MTLPMLAAFALALLINAGTPGPSIAALVSRVMTNGIRDVLPFLAALWFGEVVWMTLAVTGLSSVASTLGAGFTAIKLLGAAYLIYLAWKMWTSPISAEDASAALPKTSPGRMFGAGLLVTFGNPKIMVFYLALVPSLIPMESMSISVWAVMAITLVTILICIDLTWSLLASQARRFLSSYRARRTTNRAGAAAMAGAAVVIAVR